MMGATLGGGIGRSHGIHGMIIDALVSVRLVTADGQIIEASEKTNSDLFWGIRGAGQNFGIVVSPPTGFIRCVMVGSGQAPTFC